MIDRSGSMGAPLHQEEDFGNRFDAVKSHLMQMLKSKPVDFAFSVILFDNRIESYKCGALQQNTPANQASLEAFLTANGPRGGTDLELALECLLRVKEAQEVFLVTDGEGHGRDHLIEMASNSTVPVHCIGISLNSSASELLQDISYAGNGECSFVDSDDLECCDAA